MAREPGVPIRFESACDDRGRTGAGGIYAEEGRGAGYSGTSGTDGVNFAGKGFDARASDSC
jgi:hypothetical protein